MVRLGKGRSIKLIIGLVWCSNLFFRFLSGNRPWRDSELQGTVRGGPIGFGSNRFKVDRKIDSDKSARSRTPAVAPGKHYKTTFIIIIKDSQI